MIKEPKKILIIHLGTLGDLMLSRPALLSIRKYFKKSEIHFLGKPHLIALIKKELDIKEIFNIEGRLFLNFFAGSADFLKIYDLVILFARYKRPQWNIIFEKAPTWFIQTIPSENNIHIALYQKNQLSQYGIKGISQFIPLSFSSSISMSKADYFIHPGSGSITKNWLPQYFTKVIAEFSSLKPGLIVGPADEEIAEEILFFLENQYPRLYKKIIILKNLSLLELALIMQQGIFYLGNDSGISHLAAALGIPTFVIFGPTDAKIWQPWGKKVITFTSKTSCAPCSDEKRRNCKQRICLEDIKPEEVVEGIRRVIKAVA
ncbi:MAG TPA: glycosyltransferase family 9 protein [Candidatus Desulfofervidus auxilii]|uniref:Glycosyltransferase family 9 protein n=1 Tax=Desulfofervidus auxilii TaxID=1621989 RepID=A0A7C0YAP2_DESA2|nr:glycosyltransferase family 9 protein [Candidatus Desulfofervidus auxilii]